jgi:hypothetical protein
MKLHRNAKSTPSSRLLLVGRVIDEGWRYECQRCRGALHPVAPGRLRLDAAFAKPRPDSGRAGAAWILRALAAIPQIDNTPALSRSNPRQAGIR